MCTHGATFIRNYRKTIVYLYEDYSSKIAEYLGSKGFCLFLIEPKFYQYYASENGLTAKEMTQVFDLIVLIIKRHLPNAAIAWDLNPCKSLFFIMKF